MVSKPKFPNFLRFLLFLIVLNSKFKGLLSSSEKCITADHNIVKSYYENCDVKRDKEKECYEVRNCPKGCLASDKSEKMLEEWWLEDNGYQNCTCLEPRLISNEFPPVPEGLPEAPPMKHCYAQGCEDGGTIIKENQRKSVDGKECICRKGAPENLADTDAIQFHLEC